MSRSRPRLLIIGASGFLGTYAVQESTDRFEIIQGDRSGGHLPGTVGVDIGDVHSVDRAFRDARPDFVLLLAAMSDIDRCEALPTEAFAANARGPENVANACARGNVRLLFTSSAAVFDGKKQSYDEQDEINPLSVYGKTKAWAENAVRSLTPTAVILRFALVLGFARRKNTNAMLDGVIDQWNAGKAVSFSTSEMRNPIDATSLSRTMITILADFRITGVYHVGATDSISRYELAKRLAARVGVLADLVLRQNAPVPGRAPRGANHFLLADKIRRACHCEFGTSDQVIERCFS
jgi:dTDP-4-dehydrorhamnose reductase